MRGLSVALALVLTPGLAAAQCGGLNVVLNCQIGSKTLTVCVGEGQATYAFGPSGLPELSLTRPLGQVQATPWPGVGRSIWEDITFENVGTRYTAWISVDRMTEDFTTTGGVMVAQGEQKLADLDCKTGTAEVGVFAIADAMQAAGYCVDRATGTYAQHCPD
ncbi:hypothetical protein [uncultured Tateyamaria sp.]|uniref:hypothetical protein n=1 Tax=uncultured Tateyamaria sp. TaxID=455651 RepID=UPI00261E941D|nr:hypothetical protein [uncultured Tateyamaria sp.]